MNTIHLQGKAEQRKPLAITSLATRGFEAYPEQGPLRSAGTQLRNQNVVSNLYLTSVQKIWSLKQALGFDQLYLCSSF